MKNGHLRVKYSICVSGQMEVISWDSDSFLIHLSQEKK